MNQLKAGAILSYISIFMTFAVGLIYTPILIRMLGQSDYGLYSIVISLASYLTLLDMGLGNAIIRYVARNKQVGNEKLESDLIGQFLKFFLVISVMTMIIGSILYLQAPKIFQKSLSYSQTETAQVMILILTINYALSFPLNVYSAVVQAYERFIFLKVINIIRILVVPILSFVVLLAGAKLIALTIVTTVVNLLILSLTAFYSKWKLGVKTTFSPISKELKKDIYVYSLFIFISAIADKFYWQTDQILLGILENAKIVAVYAVAIQLILIFASLSTAISNLFLPRLSKIVSEGDNIPLLNRIFNDVSKYQFVIISLTFSGFIIFGREFIQMWAGNDFTSAYYIVIIIMIPFFGDLIQNLALMIMQAKGLYYFRAISLLICATANVFVSIPMIKLYGAYGTAIVTSVFIALSNVIVLNFYFHIKLKLDMIAYWKNIMKYSVSIGCLVVLCYVIKFYVPNTSNSILLIVEIALYTVCFFLIVWKSMFPDFKLLKK